MPIGNLLTLYTSVRLFVVLKVVSSLTNFVGVIFPEVIQRSRKKKLLTTDRKSHSCSLNSVPNTALSVSVSKDGCSLTVIKMNKKG